MFTHFARAAERLACYAARHARATRAAWIAAAAVLMATGLAEAEPSGKTDNATKTQALNPLKSCSLARIGG
jgi:hypothetical protein